MQADIVLTILTIVVLGVVFRGGWKLGGDLDDTVATIVSVCNGHRVFVETCRRALSDERMAELKERYDKIYAQRIIDFQVRCQKHFEELDAYNRKRVAAAPVEPS